MELELCLYTVKKERRQHQMSPDILYIPPSVIYYPLSQKLQVKYPNFLPQQTAENVLYRLHHYFCLWIYFSLSPLHPPLLMICCDFKRQNMEIAQRGSGIHFLITSVTNYSAQHAESVAPVDPFSPFILFIWRKGYIVSYTTRCT